MEKYKNIKEIAFHVSRRVHLSGQVVKGQMILENEVETGYWEPYLTESWLPFWEVRQR